MNYYISDLHLFSRNQTADGLNFDNRPFKNVDEMHEVILNNWNGRVTNGDTVYILGDVSNRAKIGYGGEFHGKLLCVSFTQRLFYLRGQCGQRNEDRCVY